MEILLAALGAYLLTRKKSDPLVYEDSADDVGLYKGPINTAEDLYLLRPPTPDYQMYPREDLLFPIELANGKIVSGWDIRPTPGKADFYFPKYYSPDQVAFYRKMESVYTTDAQGNKVPKPNLRFPIKIGFDKFLIGFTKQKTPFTNRITYVPQFQSGADVLLTITQRRN
jgi:hypothetical protein